MSARNAIARTLLMAAILGSVQTAKGDVLDDIATRGEIRLGVRAAAAPFSYLDQDGVPAGLAVGLCRRVAAAIQARLALPELKLSYVIVDPVTRFPSLDKGETDLICDPATATLERREIVDFSIPYFMDGIGAALRRDGVGEIEALKGQPVGAVAGTTAVRLAADMAAPVGSPLVEFPDYETGMRALGAGKIDVFFGDQGLLLYQLGALQRVEGELPIHVIDDQLSFEPYALAMRLGEHRLRTEVDRALSALYRSEEIFLEIEDALGPFEMSDLTALIYALMALPE